MPNETKGTATLPAELTVQMPVLLTVAEIATYLGASKMHVYRLIEAGELPVSDIATPGSTSTKTRVAAADLAAYIARYRTPKETPVSRKPRT